MHVTNVHVQVKPEHIQDFIAASRRNHEQSIRAPGNRRFDVAQAADDPSRFILYEAYVSAEAAAAHKHTTHYLEWREAVAPWMQTARVGILYKGICPAD